MDNQTDVTEKKGGFAAWREEVGPSVGISAHYLVTRTLFAAIIGSLTILVYQTYFAPRVITVDVRKLVAEEISQADKRGDSEARRVVLADRFNAALEAELDGLNNGRNVVLVTAAVVRGGEDRTAEVQARIRAAMEARK